MTTIKTVEVYDTIHRISRLLTIKTELLKRFAMVDMDDKTEIDQIAYDLVHTIKALARENRVYFVLTELYMSTDKPSKRLDIIKTYRDENEFYISLKESVFLNVLIGLMEEMLLSMGKQNTSVYKAVASKAPMSEAQKEVCALRTKINNNRKNK